MDWTEKHRPSTLSAVCGNSSSLKELRKWAADWDASDGAVVLHGRPGIGKTTAAHALANEMGWQAIEMNASEQRTKDIVKKVAGSAANMGTLQEGTSGQRLVILDEADSLHGNKDRGGSGAMSKVVREAEQPVILIANEYYEMSKGIRNSCKDISFDLVETREIVSFLQRICHEEDIAYTDDALTAIAEKADGDVRGAVNDLQAVTSSVSGTLTVDDLPTSTRDRKENIFQYLDTLLQDGSPQDAHETARSVDETPDELFNWIEDNLPKEYDGVELWNAYSRLARADVWLGRVYSSDHNYKYWRYANDQMTAGVAASREGYHGGWTRWGPPGFWRKLGSTRGTRNTRNEIARRIAEKSNVSMETAKNDIIPYLSSITHHCKNREVTVAMAAVYELDEKEVSFITGSGKDTKKVASIVEDADDLRAAAAADAAVTGTGQSTEDSDGTSDVASFTSTPGADDTSGTNDNDDGADESDGDDDDGDDGDDSDGMKQATLF